MISIQTELQKLAWISPSRFTALQRCPYNVVLSGTIEDPLLPYKPSKHLGKVIHKCIELIFAGKIRTAEKFEQEWEKLIHEEEIELKNMGFSFLIPLMENVSGFFIKKLQVKKLIDNKSSESYNHHGNSYLEKWLKSQDELIIGKVDLLYQNNSYAKIIDFKSGQVLDNDGDVKEDFKKQLKLYAFLHKEEYDRYPDELSVIDVNNREYSISFTPEECESLSVEAKELLFKINSLIERNSREKLANPNLENCKWCLYKPACKFHWEIDSESKFQDVTGKLISVRKFQNGNVNLSLLSKGDKIVIEGYNQEMFSYFIEKENQELAFYNLLSLDKPSRYKKIKTTTIYSKFDNTHNQ